MPYPGSYVSAYQQQPPPWGYQWGPPPQQWGGGQDMNNNLISFIIPLLTTLPGLRTGQNTAATLKANLQALPVPPALLPAQVVMGTDYNKLLDYANGIKTAVSGAFDNDNNTYNILRQGILLQVITQMASGGNNQNTALFLVLALAFGGGF